MGDGQQGDRQRQQERLGPRRSRHQRVLETRRQDRRPARRQRIGKAPGRGAIARRKEGGCDPQAKRNQKVGSAQDRAEEAVFHEVCFRGRGTTFQRELSYPAHAGYPVRRGFSIPSQSSLEYWIARSSRAMTAVGVARVSTPSLRAQAKQSMGPRQERMDCFVALLLAM